MINNFWADNRTEKAEIDVNCRLGDKTGCLRKSRLFHYYIIKCAKCGGKQKTAEFDLFYIVNDL